MRISDWSSDAAPSRKKRGRWGGCLPWAIIGAVLFTIFAIWKFPSFKAQAELGSAYAARVGCSCRYVQGRSLESCQSDFEPGMRSEEHTSELQSLMRISYAVFCLKKK